jgi:hypothetical protein
MIHERHIKASRIAKRCDWCSEMVEVGHPKVSYRWVDGRDVGTCNMHPECFDAMGDVASDGGGETEFTPGAFSRGCGCEKGHCECGVVTDE